MITLLSMRNYLSTATAGKVTDLEYLSLQCYNQVSFLTLLPALNCITRKQLSHHNETFTTMHWRVST